MSARPSFFAELQRRHVYKVGAMYCVAGWLLVQVVTQVLPVFDVSALGQRILVLVVVAGFPVALVLAWLFDITPEGIVRTPDAPAAAESPVAVRQRRGMDRKLNYLLGALLILALGYLALERTLLRGGAAAVATDDKSIAVLPFENLSDDKANAYFAEGIQDEILTRLARIGALRVISRTSTQPYGAKPGNLSEIARQLHVANILEGSVQKSGDAVHINVQLIRADTDEHLWAESYNRKLDDIFGVEGEVAQTIAERMNAALSGAEKQQVTARLTDNPAAYDAYLRGLAFASHADAITPNTISSIAAFGEAVRLDPGFAAAWGWLSRQQSYIYWWSDPSSEHEDGARTALEMATRLAPDSDEALRAEGFYRYWVKRDYEGAAAIFHQVLLRLPNDDRAIFALAAIARRQGRWSEAATLQDQALLLDPRDMLLYANAALTAVSMRDYVKAQRLVDRGLDISPDDPGMLSVLAWALEAQGQVEAAQKALDRIRIAPGDSVAINALSTNAMLRRKYGPAIELIKSQLAKPEPLGQVLGNYQVLLGELYRLDGQADAARQAYLQAQATLQADLLRTPGNTDVLSNLAQVAAGLGNRDEALERIGQAIALLPASKDALQGPALEDDRMRLQARFGDADDALAGIRHLLSIAYSGSLTRAAMRLDPDFDALRGDPRFQALLAEPGP